MNKMRLKEWDNIELSNEKNLNLKQKNQENQLKTTIKWRGLKVVCKRSSC